MTIAGACDQQTTTNAFRKRGSEDCCERDVDFSSHAADGSDVTTGSSQQLNPATRYMHRLHAHGLLLCIIFYLLRDTECTCPLCLIGAMRLLVWLCCFSCRCTDEHIMFITAANFKYCMHNRVRNRVCQECEKH